MSKAELRKQISIFLPVSDWRTLRQEAAQQNVPITELCRRWICPEIAALKRQGAGHDRARDCSPRV